MKPEDPQTPYVRELKLGVNLGYISSLADASGPIRRADFVVCLHKALKMAGCPADGLTEPSKPKTSITRQEAVKVLVAAVLSPKEITDICTLCGGADTYLNDFLDASKVSPWARPYFTAAIYRGWVPDRTYLQPDQPATRGYIAALLV